MTEASGWPQTSKEQNVRPCTRGYSTPTPFTGKNIGSGDMVLVHIEPQGQLLGFRLYPTP
jgi:hypothetical protein